MTSRTTIDALVNLLEDEDRHVSTAAMEELLRRDGEVDHVVAEFQEADNPVLRSRIHQIGNVLKLRRARDIFISNVGDASVDLWEGLLQINYQFNPRMSRRDVDQFLEELAGRLPRRLTSVRMAAFMRNENFTFTKEDVLGADLYLPEDVLLQRVGSPILLAVVTQQLGERRSWHASIVLHKGRHCLIDSNCNLVEPAEGWRVTRLTNNDKLHPCTNRDIWFTVLAQLFLSALQEGRLQAIHRVGSILSRLCGGNFGQLPFPLGS
jgi:hypothetical protein